MSIPIHLVAFVQAGRSQLHVCVQRQQHFLCIALGLVVGVLRGDESLLFVEGASQQLILVDVCRHGILQRFFC